MQEHAHEACVDEGGASDGPALDDRSRNEIIKAYAATLNRMSRTSLALRVNTMLIERGIDPLSEGSIYRIIKYGVNVPVLENGKPRPRKRPRKSQASASKQRDWKRQADSTALRNAINRSNDIHQYESMMNAPPNKLNNPLIRSAEQVQHLLVELSALDPEVAVTQIPIERCRQWTPEFAVWWARFTELCEQRRLAETPDIPPMPYPRRQKLDTSPEVPTDEYQLSPTQASVIAWMRTQSGPLTCQVISERVNLVESTVYTALAKLTSFGMVAADTSMAPYTYTVVVPAE